MVAEIVSMDKLPLFISNKKGPREKYPWRTIQPGDAFKFDPIISLGSARSQIANAMRNLVHADGLERRFVVRIDNNNELWCIRVDHLSLEERERWRNRQNSLLNTTQKVDDNLINDLRQAGPHEVLAEEQGEDNPNRGHVYSIGTVDPGDEDLI